VKRLGKKFGKKVLPYVMAGALAFSTLLPYGCGDDFVEPKPKKPVAMFFVQPTSGEVPLEVNFDGSGSYAREGQIAEYRWDVNGDGKTDLTTSGASGAYIKHTYEEPGEYDPTLVVKDSKEQLSDKAKLLEKIVVNENIISLGQIAFWSNRDQGTGELYLADITKNDLEKIKRLTNNNNNDIWPAWSPDGRYLVWSANRATPDGWFALYVVDPSETDGDDERRITPFIDGFSAYDPIWCTNGKIYFNFLDRNSGEQGIARINSDGNGLIDRIIKEQYHNWLSRRPACSPDGSQIAFVTDRDGNTEIYIANIDGTGEWNLTNHPANDRLPVWYGDELFFISDRDGTPDIWAINSSGGGLRKILENSGIETDINI